MAPNKNASLNAFSSALASLARDGTLHTQYPSHVLVNRFANLVLEFS
jgi:hypothetical protein